MTRILNECNMSKRNVGVVGISKGKWRRVVGNERNRESKGRKEGEGGAR